MKVIEVTPSGEYPTRHSFRQAVYSDPSQVMITSANPQFSGSLLKLVSCTDVQVIVVHGADWEARVTPRDGKFTVRLRSAPSPLRSFREPEGRELSLPQAESAFRLHQPVHCTRL